MHRTDACPENAYCIDTIGSYECECYDGYTDIGAGFAFNCQNIDECEMEAHRNGRSERFCHVPVPLSRLREVLMTRLKDVALVQLALIPMVVMNVDVKKVTNTQDQRKMKRRKISNLELGILIIHRLEIELSPEVRHILESL